MTWTDEFGFGRTYPRFYGFAWRKWDVCSNVLLPIPFNVIARWFRAAWIWFKQNKNTHEQQIADVNFEKGHRAGIRSEQSRIRAFLACEFMKDGTDSRAAVSRAESVMRLLVGIDWTDNAAKKS